jgi:hypothetical protein
MTDTAPVKWAWSKLVFVYFAIGILMTILGWKLGLESYLWPSSGFSLSDVEAQSYAIVPRRGRAVSMDVNLKYVLSKNRNVNVRNCVATVTHPTQDAGGRYESTRFDVTGTNERVTKSFNFKVNIALEGEKGSLRVSCSEGIQTDTKEFNFGEAAT